MAKPAAADGDCSEGLAKHLQGGNLVMSTGSRLQAAVDCKVSKMMVIFTKMTLCPNTFEPLKTNALCIEWL